MDNIGEKLYELRKKRGLSQEQLGYEVGVSRQTISKWEQNAMQPNLENIQSLSSVLKEDVTYFLSSTSESNSSIENEVAFTEQGVKSNKKNSFLIFGIIFATLCLGAFIYTIIVGLTALTNNKGYVSANTVNIELGLFIIALLISIILLVLSLLFILKFIKANRR